jgi:sulfocyanin
MLSRPTVPATSSSCRRAFVRRLALLGLGLAALPRLRPALAQQPVTPSWITPDAAGQKVAMDVIAGFNPNNNAWNFNGYYEGNATVVVPEGWRVQIDFTTRDANYPHSLVVIEDPGSPDAFPEEAGREQVAISRAYSKSPIEGIFGDDSDRILFEASPAGDYLWFCGVHGHGLAGMWIRFKITADAEAPHLLLAADAEPGRP